MVDAYGSEPYGATLGGSSPLSGTGFSGQACSVQNAVPARAWEFESPPGHIYGRIGRFGLVAELVYAYA